jgi:D-alanyl-D-alanine dipeptidase
MDSNTGKDCSMPTDFDSPSSLAYSRAKEGITKQRLANRGLLQAAMIEAGFSIVPHEWWHFNYRDIYLVVDTPLGSL